MFTEIKQVRQIPGEDRRRWFAAEGMDLIVWEGGKAGFTGFQLCFDKGGVSRALTWDALRGFNFNRVDEGDNRCGKYKQSPILIPAGLFDAQELIEPFSVSSPGLPEEVAAFVKAKLEEFSPAK